jgi:polyribonucleotide 5'-hydroxyl-kinase
MIFVFGDGVICVFEQDGFTMGSPLVYCYGHLEAKKNADLYRQLVSNMSSKIRARQQSDSNVRSSGCIINTQSFDGSASGVELINNLIAEFAVCVVLVLNHDRLYSSLSKNCPEGVTIVKLPRSGGVASRVRFTLYLLHVLWCYAS